DRIASRCEHDGNCRCRLLCCEGRWGVVCENESDLSLDEFGCDFAKPLGVSLAPAIVDNDIAALAPSKLLQPFEERSRPLPLRRPGTGTQHPFDRCWGPLRSCCGGPCARCAAQQRDDPAASHADPQVFSCFGAEIRKCGHVGGTPAAIRSPRRRG